MPPILSKTLLALVLLLCVTPCTYLLTWAILHEIYISTPYPMVGVPAFLIANLSTGAVVYVTWVLLWRREVRWTKARRIKTLLALVISVVPAALAYLGVASWSDDELAMFLAGLVWMTGWLGATAVIWRETPAERAQRTPGGAGFKISCVKCGYDMTGLYEARCPECGTQYTLDVLLAASVKEDPLGHRD